MNQIAKILLIYTGLIILVGIIFGIYSYFTSYQYLVLQVPEDRQQYVSLYKADAGEGGYTKNQEEKIDIEFNTDMKLDRGLYVAEYNQEGFEPVRREINLDKEIISVSFEYKIATPALEVIKEANIDAIHVSMEQAYPGILSQYSILEENVYDDGNWYGAILESKDNQSLQRDTVRVVLHNEAGTWKVVAKPYITISKAEYPEIPTDLLNSINRVPGQLPGQK